jgi:hypothetical protein
VPPGGTFKKSAAIDIQVGRLKSKAVPGARRKRGRGVVPECVAGLQVAHVVAWKRAVVAVPSEVALAGPGLARQLGNQTTS